MAMTSGRATCSVSAGVKGTFPPQGVSSTLDPTEISQSASAQMAALSFGTATGQIDLITCSDRTIAGGASATYDLYTGTDLKDLDGNTCAFRKVRLAVVTIVTGGDANGIAVGGAASAWPAFFVSGTGRHTIFPSGPPYLGGSPAGVAVGALTCNLKIENLGVASATVRILLAGTSV